MAKMKLSPAAKLQLVMDLLYIPLLDKDGNIIGYEETGIISKKEVLELLGFKTE